ncbi:MCP four helix bundle domain-containing protein [candidate division KSB1 bacterium]|nr:MCP four helix bundle domain-containing protein [candidate division KSB1 bacterium]
MKLRIRQRMIAGFLIMSTLLIILGILAIFYTDRMQTNTTQILAENVSSLKSAEELEIALLNMKGFTANYLIDNDEGWIDAFSEKKAVFHHWFDIAQKRAHTDAEISVLKKIDQDFKTYLSYQKHVIKLTRQNSLKDAQKILFNEMWRTFDLLYEHCEKLITMNEVMMEEISQQIKNDNQTVNRVMYLFGLLGIIMGLALGAFLARSITHPIYELVLKLKSVTGEEHIEKLNINAGTDTELENLDKHVKNLIGIVYEANKNLERSQKMLIQSEKLASLGKMAAGLAHEIRNPLTAIKMLIFTLVNEVKNNFQMSQDFQVILTEIERMDKFLQNFLDFARPPIPNFVIIEMNEIIRQTLNLLAPQIKNAGIRLERNLSIEELTIFGDKDQVQIVLMNIIINSIQAMTPSGKLKIGSRKATHPDFFNELVQIQIRDTGPGIPIEIFENIFDPFVTGKATGTGLGLSIAYQFVRNHNGWIDISNNPDDGATFTLNLPFKERNI